MANRRLIGAWVVLVAGVVTVAGGNASAAGVRQAALPPAARGPAQALVPRAYLPLTFDRGNPAAPEPLPGTATVTPTLPPSATPTVTPSPTATEPPTATPTATPVPGPPWQMYLNGLRAASGLRLVTEDEAMSSGAVLHSQYMVKNGVVEHSETPGNPWYTPEGLKAAQDGNIFVSSRMGLAPTVPIDFWMVGAFHMVGLMDPLLAVSGYGDYTENLTPFKFGATLNVLGGRTTTPDQVTYPVMVPGHGSVYPYTTFGGGEFPDPLDSCPGYAVPSGPPLALMLDPASPAPNVTHTSLRGAGGGELAHCAFDETNYKSGTYQQLGRGVLRMRRAMIILPKAPLDAGGTYTVAIDVSGAHHEWVFTAASVAARTSEPLGVLGLPPYRNGR